MATSGIAMLSRRLATAFALFGAALSGARGRIVELTVEMRERQAGTASAPAGTRRSFFTATLATPVARSWPLDCNASNAVEPHRLLLRIVGGDVANVRFDDLTRLLLRLGFVLRRTAGSHHIYVHSAVPQVINVQEVGGKAKSYQVRQVVRLIERYNLSLEDAP